MSCERYRSTLTDVALGVPAPPEVERHLTECASCRAALESERRLIARIDDGLREALEIEPSPALLPRVRRRVAQGAAPFARWVPWLVRAAVGVGIVALGIRFAGRRHTGPPAPVEKAAQRPAVLAPKESRSEAATIAKMPVLSAVARVRAARRAEPEVLVPAGEEAVLRRFLEDLHRQGSDRLSMLAAWTDRSELGDISVPAIDVKPLMIEPIDRSES